MNPAGPRVRFVGTAALLALLAGCMVPIHPKLPAPTRLITEPATEGKYYRYIPSTYRADRAYSLVVTCHGTTPWDTARFQIDEWAPLAEEKDFIVIAPKLAGTRGDFPGPPEAQIERQRRDEKVILAAVQHVRAGHNVAVDQVFLTGWSAGSYAVLYTGLKHPEVFRALAIRQGNFNPLYLKPIKPLLDPYQPVYVLFGSLDVLVADQIEGMLEWMREQKLFLHHEEVYGAHQRHPKRVYDFFKRCIKRYAWLRIETYEREGDDPLGVRLRLTGAPVPNKFKWRFGDETESRAATPYHVYAEPGTYEIRVVARVGRKQMVRRLVQIEVPRPAFGAAPRAQPAAADNR